MKSVIPVLVILLFASTFVVGYQAIYSRSVETCHLYRDVTQDYRISLYDFAVQAFKDVGPSSSYHFIFSPLSVWIILAAIAEGASPFAQQQMFRLLGLSNDPCVRLRYYQLATSRYQPSNDVHIASTRLLAVDDGVTVNPDWLNFVSKNQLVNILSLPIKNDTQTALNAIRLFSAATLADPNLTGNSVFVDVMEYSGLWATAFSNAIIYRSPFYDNHGSQIGSVDLMRVNRPAKMAFLSSLNTKFLELPIGVDDRYRILIGLPLDDSDIDTVVKAMKKTIVFEIMSKSQVSEVPIEIAIPRFTMTSDIDVRSILENLGVRTLWTDPSVSRYITDPALLPSSFLQRSTITLDILGINPALDIPETPYNVSTGLDPAVGRDFIANRSFMFALFDAETYTCLMSSVYTQPTYNY